MRVVSWSFVFIVLFLSSLAHSQILMDEDGSSMNQTRTKQADSGFDFRKKRKFGVGLSTAGALGLVGANLEIVFTPESSFMGGFGLGDSYQTFALQYKKAIGGRWFVPYVGGGFARWYTAGDKNGSVQDTSPGFLADRFLNDEERRSGEFAENLIYPMAGVQYYQLKGDWAGSSLYAQIMMLFDMDDFVSAATGEFGVFYYF